MKSMIETQERKLQAKMAAVSKLDEDYAKLAQQCEEVKRDVQMTVDNLIASIEAKKQTKPTKANPKCLPILVFVENQEILKIVNTEDIGTLKILQQTEASQSIVEGKNIQKGTVGCETQFFLVTKTAEGRQCYNKHDRVTVEIRDEQGRECPTELRINDNKDGNYKISFSLKDQGKYNVTVRVNGKPIRHGPFSVEMKLFQFRPVLAFGTEGSSNRILNYPWGVAVNARDEIAVTDCLNHRVLIFNSEGNCLRSFGQQGSNAGEFKWQSL